MMMKSFAISNFCSCLLGMGGILLLLPSCQGFLDKEPEAQISINEQLSNLEGMLVALNGAYRQTREQADGIYFIYADLVGGNLTFTPTMSGSNQGQVRVPSLVAQVYDFNDDPLDSDFDFFYRDGYDVINNLNLILRFVEEIDADMLVKDQIRAEVLSLRAYNHFLLSLVYAQQYNFTPDASHLGIVYNTRTLVAGVDFPKRLSVAETYALIRQDLLDALSLFTDAPALPGPAYAYFRPVAVQGLLARLALYREDWVEAVQYSDLVIQDGGIPLLTTDNYLTEWAEPNVPPAETILEWSVAVDGGGAVSNTIATLFEVQYQSGGQTVINYGDYVASRDLVDRYDRADIRRSKMLIEEELFDESYFFTQKFQDNTGTLVMRLSEMHLIRAEARAQLNDPQAALGDLNLIRSRANPFAAPLRNLTGAELLEAIFQERRKELAFEGHYLFDVARNKRSINRGEGCLSARCTLSYPNAFYILPIPQATIDVNENMQQNEGY